MKRSTFVRKGASRQNLPQGTKPSVHNGQLLISSGIHDMDQILGGGLPVGTLVCVQEDEHSQYCQNLLKYFISEGVSCQHTNLLCSPTYCPDSQSLETYLPFNYSNFLLEQEEKKNSSTTSQTSTKHSQDHRADANAVGLSPLQQQLQREGALPMSSQSTGGSNELKIAWRYKEYVEQQEKSAKLKQEQHLSDLKQQREVSHSGVTKPSPTRQLGTVLCHEYDLSKNLQKEILERNKATTSVIDLGQVLSDSLLNDSNEPFDTYPYLYNQIQQKLNQSKTIYTSKNNNASIVRIALQSIGSSTYGETNYKQILRFLYALKAALRSSLAVCIFTVPRQLFNPESSILDHMTHVSDIVIRMDSFTGSRIDVTEYEFREYSGTFTLLKLPKLNSLTVNYAPDSLQYAFKMKKRKMYVEKMHLPPEETRDASNPSRIKYSEGSVNDVIKSSTKQNVTTGCGTSSEKNDLDF